MMRIAAVAVLGIVVSSCDFPDAALRPRVNLPDETSRQAIDEGGQRLVQVDLGTLGGPYSYAADINERDVVVGWSRTPTGETHAFRWSAEQGMVDLGTLPGDNSSRALAILDGRMLGTAEIIGISGTTPVVWSATGEMSVLSIPLLPGSRCIGAVNGFNMRGEVIGRECIGYGHAWIWSAADGKLDLTMNDEMGSPEGEAIAITGPGTVLLRNRKPGECRVHFRSTCWRSYLWTRTGGYTALGTPDESDADISGLDLNERGTVVGWLQNAEGTFAFRWDAQRGFEVLATPSSGFLGSVAYGVNARGTVVGSARDPVTGMMLASAWSEHGELLRLSAEPSNAAAINERGTIAGWTSKSTGYTHAVIWRVDSLGAGSPPSIAAPRATSLPRSFSCLANREAIASRSRLAECIIAADDST